MTTKAECIINKPLIRALTIIFVVFLIYSNTFNAPFQFDDTGNIADNSAIKDLRYFSDPSFVKNTNIQRSLIPLFKTRYIGYLTFALNYMLHGLDVRGYHLVNIFIHMLNSLLLYWFMTLTFRTPFFLAAGRHPAFPDSSRNFMAFFTALLFAVHPIQTQAVTYIVQRFTSLATLFYLISFVMYIKWKESNERQAKFSASSAMLYAVSLLSAILAMKTKEFAFTLPLVMAMYELMFFDGKIKKRLLYLTPFFLTILLIPMALAGTGGSFTDISGINDEAVNISGATGSISREDYLFTQFRVIVTYIRLLFLPVNQNIDYDYPIYKSFFSPAVFLSFLFLLSVIIAVIYMYYLSKRSETKDRSWLRLISFGIFWFFIALSAESAVIPIRDVIYEHRVYLPSIGFFIALTAAVGAGMESWESRAAYSKKAVVYVMITAVLVLSVAAYARNTVWQDSIRLWENAVEGSPNKAGPHIGLGLAYFKQGRTDEAINEYQTAQKLNPYENMVHFNLGLAYFNQGRINEAINEFKSELKIKSNNAEARYYLGLAYATQGKIEKSIYEFEIALELDPDYVDAHYNLGIAYGAQGRSDEAIKEFKIALMLKPDLAETHYNLGVVYAKHGSIDEAIKKFKIALMLNPDYVDAHNNLGVAYGAQGRSDEAIKEFKIALKLKPDLAETHYNLGVAYRSQSRSDEAINEYQIALKLKPDFAQARQNLDLLLKK
jgi:tetratricopeptide (TPR) repeat protein